MTRTRAWQCKPPRLQLVVKADRLAGRLSAEYAPADAGRIAGAAVADTLRAIAGLPAGHGITDRLRARAPGLLLRTVTPQVGAALLTRAVTLLGSFDVVLGSTVDGGWWALGVREPARSAPLAALTDAAELALAALRLGLRVAMLPTLQQVGTAADARRVARLCPPGSSFAATLARAEPLPGPTGRRRPPAR